MLGRGLLMMAALLACGASGSFAQTEPAEAVDREATRPAIEADSKPSREVIRRLAAQSRLASRLLERLAKEPNAGDNIVVWPASVAMALSVLELGADEKLRAAIAQALGYEAAAAQSGPTAAIARKKPPAKSSVQAGKATEDLKGLLQVIIDLDRDKDMQGVLSLANSIIFDPDAAPSDLALRGLRETGAKVAVEKLSTEETLKGINDWVSAKTNGLIPTILETPPRNSGLVALNALYFKDKWKFPFEVSNTKPGRFEGLSGELDVAMMNMARHLHRVQNSERFVGVELPYIHERFAM